MADPGKQIIVAIIGAISTAIVATIIGILVHELSAATGNGPLTNGIWPLLDFILPGPEEGFFNALKVLGWGTLGWLGGYHGGKRI